MTRLEFVRWAGAALGAIALRPVAALARVGATFRSPNAAGGEDGLPAEGVAAPTRSNGEIPQRLLGRTGANVSVLGLGGGGLLYTLGRRDAAVRLIRHAIALGVNYCDTARLYGPSESYYGEALSAGFRERVFLATKTQARDGSGARRQLETSLKTLRTDRVDLIQIHNVQFMRDLDPIFAVDGVYRALQAARDEGLCRFVGITGHFDPHVMAEALRREPFDACLVALNAADRRYLSFIEHFLPVARERRVPVIGMKVVADGRLLKHLAPADALHYTLSLPGVVTAIMGCGTQRELEENVEGARAFKPLDPAEMAALEARVKPLWRERINIYQLPAG